MEMGTLYKDDKPTPDINGSYIKRNMVPTIAPW